MDEAGRSRDRGATELALVEAARQQLADSGFQGLGVNAIARRAGCDKQLIYRYFGGIEGLVDAIGARVALDLHEQLATFSGGARPGSYVEFAERMVLGFLETMRADPLLRKIMLWEIADPSPLVARLTAARSRAMVGWVLSARGNLTPPPGTDAPAANAVLVAAVQQLVLSAGAVGQFSGLQLQSDADWQRVSTQLVRLVRAIYGDPPLRSENGEAAVGHDTAL